MTEFAPVLEVTSSICLELIADGLTIRISCILLLRPFAFGITMPFALALRVRLPQPCNLIARHMSVTTSVAFLADPYEPFGTWELFLFVYV